MTLAELINKIRRNLGAPMVKVELTDAHITDAINYATSKWKTWATGNATQEVYFTMALSASQYLYDMPLGTVDVISYESTGTSSGINTLFTVDNYLFNNGMYDSLLNSYSGDYNIVSYHIARDFLETVRKYTPDAYNFKYHKYTNKLEIQPPPPSGGSLTYTPKYLDGSCSVVAGDEITIDSPGFILLRTYMLQGASYDACFDELEMNEEFYEHVQWIDDYATAKAKKTLGMIRRKFGNFGNLGNQGISLDGSDLMSEADAEMERLMEELTLKETYEGYGIYLG